MDRLAAAELPAPLAHQRAALAAYEHHRDRDRFQFVMPPGSGKTVLGSLIAQRAGRPILVLVPNTAIQAQWVALWQRAGAVTVATDRHLTADVTVLTYQAVATFDGEQLHADAAEMIARLHVGPPFTLILDEAHHLAAVWGQVLTDMMEQANAIVVALTATPPGSLTPDEAAQIDELYGPVLHEVSTPALVRDGVLAPYREFAWFVSPTPAEREYLALTAVRWQELLAAVMADDFGSPGLLEYIDDAWVQHEGVSWTYIEKNRPEVARALVRMAHAGMCAVPQGARMRDEHREPVQVEDWVAVLSDYGRTALADPQQPGWEALRSGLRSVGWTLTTRGARPGQSPIDRVLARSAGKAVAAGYLVAQEALIRGDDLRAIVLTDFENAQAAPPADVRNVLARQAGSAWEAVTQVQAANPGLNVVLMTAASVGGSAQAVAAVVRPGLSVQERDDGLCEVVGAWGPRDWVPHVTALFQSGRVDVLVGTRGLLGEGWDAPAANVLIDLTVATTATAVVQVRGRAIRRDPQRPDKVAHVWSVTAVEDGNPRGDLDYRRLVAKHRGYLAPDADGLIVAGISHLDSRCSAYAPPAAQVREAINAGALDAAMRLDAALAMWQVGTPYRDVVQVAVRVRRGARPAPHEPVGWWPAVGLAAAGSAGAAVTDAPALAVVGAGVLGASAGWGLSRLRRRSLDGLLMAFGQAVASLLRPGAVVEVVPTASGQWTVRWDGGPEFAAAVEQILDPIDFPRYIISRRLGLRAVMWHAVPDVFGVNKAAAQAFADRWRRFVGRGQLLYTGSAEGGGVADAVRGLDPMDLSSALFAQWG